MVPLASSLIKACKNNDRDAVHILAEDHALTGVDTREQTLLFYAVKAESYAVLAYCIEHGLNVNHPNHIHETALHIAARLGDEKSIQLLLAAGADIRMTNDLDQTALMLAAGKGSLESVEALLEKKASVFATDSAGETGLFYAVRGRKRSVLKRFIEADAFVHHVNHQNQTLIHEVAAIGDQRLLEELLAADVNPFLLNIHHQSPLHIATFKHHTGMIEALLECGLEPSIHDHFEQSPGRYAQAIGQSELITVFERHPFHPTVKSYAKRFPLHDAVRKNHLEKALVILTKEKSPSEFDAYGKTALFYAAINQDAYLVDALLTAGHKATAFQETGISLKLLALLIKQPSLLEVLKKHQIFSDFDALETAYIKRHPTLMQYLA